MSKLIWKPSTLLGPLPPALVSCGTMEKPNVLTVAWTGIVNTDPAMTYVSIRPARFSYGLIEKSGEFAINLPTAALARACDFCGVRSGARVDKFREMRLTPEAGANISAPLIAESPLSLECRVRQKLPLGSHTMFLADILSVDVDEKLLDRDGKLCLERAGLLAFAHGAYYALRRELGTFGFSVRKKRTRPGVNSARHGKRG